MATSQVIVFVGAGGVGKTSSAIATALAAVYQGKRVGLLSIDPAKRLAAAMGLALSGHPQEVPIVDAPPGGRLKACMLDQKAVFDEMVRRFAPTAQVAQKILDHELYEAAAAGVSGSIEYMALVSLQDMVASGEYDLVVLDTPPAHNALDFLRRPNVLARFMEHGVMTWLVKPFHLASRFGLDRLLAAGEKLMGGVAKVTGVHALRTVSEFLTLIQQVIDGFHLRGQEILETLQDPSTRFVLVTNPRAAAVRVGLHLKELLSELGYHIDFVVLNRSLPEPIRTAVSQLVGHQDSANMGYLRQRSSEEERLRDLVSSEARRIKILTIDETDESLHSLSSMSCFAENFVSLL